MKHFAVVFAEALAFTIALSAAPAHGQNARSFVSGHGLDTNTCSLTAPCRTLAAALANTNAGGEIDVLDPAGYGPLTINKAISIVNDGVGTSSILVPSGGIGITINAAVGDAVSLRGLTIEGAGIGGAGIRFNTGQSLAIENCVIRHLTEDGIEFFPNASSNLSVSNTLTANNGNFGVFFAPSGSGLVTAMFNRVTASNNALQGIVVNGLSSTGTVRGTVSDSVAAHNGGVGFRAVSSPGQAAATLMLFNSVSTDNGTGTEAIGSGATLRLARSMVTGNGNGWLASSSGIVLSAGDNTIEGNISNETTPPPYNQK